MSSPCFVIAGTDTDVGKTVFAAALTGALTSHYWKPVQAGLDARECDSARVARLSGVAVERILPSAYRLTTPCSPHRAAELDGVQIDTAKLALPKVEGPLVVEPAGGLLVPLTRSVTFIDILVQWACPVVLVARTALGTINHSLLSLEALRARSVPVHGVAFVGDSQPETEMVIVGLGNVRRLGRLPLLNPLNRDTLSRAFQEEFDRGDIA